MGAVPTQAAWMELMTETTRFMIDRFQQDLEAQQAFLASRTPQEMVTLQAEFVRNTIEQYMAQSTRLTEMMSGTTKQALNELKSGHARKYDDVPL